MVWVLIETVLLSAQNIYFSLEIRKIILNYSHWISDLYLPILVRDCVSVRKVTEMMKLTTDLAI